MDSPWQSLSSLGLVWQAEWASRQDSVLASVHHHGVRWSSATHPICTHTCVP